MTTALEEAQQELARTPLRWLVTGAAGFIGSALVEALLGLEQEVVALDNFATGKRENLHDALEASGADSRGLQFIEGDVCDLEVCKPACREIDIVLHQAALGSVPRSLEDPYASHDANVNGFLRLALAARDAGVRRVVFASSSSVYGDRIDLPQREHSTGAPLSPYAATKRIDETYAGVLGRCFGQDFIGLRYFNVFGRRQDPNGAYAAVIPKWIARLKSGQPCEVNGDGTQTRDFCYVDNAVQANLLAATAGAQAAGRVFNVGCGDRTSLLELFDTLRRLVAESVPEAGEAQPLHVAARAGDLQNSQADISLIREHLGYQPTHRVAEGLKETVAWFLSD